MLKILNTKLTKSRKSVIPVGGDGKEKHSDKAELNDGKEVNGNDIYSDKVDNNNVVEEKNY